MNPRPTEKSYENFYKNYFWEEAFTNLRFKKEKQKWNSQKFYLDNDKKWDYQEGKKILIKKLNQSRNNLLFSTINTLKINNKSKILEIGAGIGTNLLFLRKKFLSSVYAIEPSIEARKEIKSQKIKIIGSFAKDLKNIKDKFDLIIFSHSLENTVNPEIILKYAKDCLKKNGSIYIQCSNLFLFDQMNPYHPFIFSYNSFRYLAKRSKFKLKIVSDSLSNMLEIILTKS